MNKFLESIDGRAIIRASLALMITYKFLTSPDPSDSLVNLTFMAVGFYFADQAISRISK